MCKVIRNIFISAKRGDNNADNKNSQWQGRGQTIDSPKNPRLSSR